MDRPSAEQRVKRTRWLTPILGFFLGFLCLVVGRILYLQVAHGEELRKQSQVNRIQHEVLPAPRGVIRDTRGTLLAADEPVSHLVHRSYRALGRDDLRLLADGMDLPLHVLRQHPRPDQSRYLWKGLSDRQRIWFAEHRHRLDGVDVQVRPNRVYQYGAAAAPVLGYTGEIDPDELDRRRTEGLSQGKFVGKAGIEKYYDARLQGRDGMRWIETTARGDFIRVLDSPSPIEPRPGEPLSLNLDARLQQKVAASFPADSEGAAVVMEIPSGEIRALYSHPGYNPNQIVTGQSEQVDELLHHPDDPLHNRVVQSRFPPGSTFKIVAYLAALENPDFPSGTTFFDPGYFQLGNQTYRCWKRGGHGRLNLHEALVHSCNVYFYKLVRKLGYRRILETSRRLGYHRPTGIDLPGEKPPQLSSPAWKRRHVDRPWVEGDAINAVIGQGYTLVSPIKQAQFLGSLLAGRIVVPRVAEASPVDTGSRSLSLSASQRRRLIRTLDNVTEDGTGYWAQHRPNYRPIDVDVFGKTGTVQKVTNDEDGDTVPSDGWFVSAAPREDPRYVVVVFRADAGSGSHSAAPHARRIYRAMLEIGLFDRDGPARSRDPESSRVARTEP